jgi:hypothetical protein
VSGESGQATALVVVAIAIGTALVTIAAAFGVGAVARAHAQRVADEVALVAASEGAATDEDAIRAAAVQLARREGARLVSLAFRNGAVEVEVVTSRRTFRLPAFVGGGDLVAAGSASARAIPGPTGPRLVR